MGIAPNAMERPRETARLGQLTCQKILAAKIRSLASLKCQRHNPGTGATCHNNAIKLRGSYEIQLSQTRVRIACDRRDI